MSNQEILKLSSSKAKVFDDCKKKYHYSYILKLPQKDFEFHVFGKFLHSCLENFHNFFIQGGKELPNKVMTQMFKDAREEYKEKITQDQLKEAREILASYLKKIEEPTEKNSNILSVEKRFNVNITDRIILNGMIDRVQKDEDGVLHVIDYKSTKNKKYLKDFSQLLTYAFVLLEEDPTLEKIRGSYVLLRHNFEYMTKEFSKEEILSVKEKYQESAKKIEEEQLYEASPTFLCNYCSYVDKCREGQMFLNSLEKVGHGEVSW